jgi:hypothetical protein
MSDVDDRLRAAAVQLDGEIGDGTDPGFSRKVSARLEVDVMQGNTRTHEEHSGLHELKNLARSAKQRHSQRVSSQVEAQESLLASTAALDAVALPNPSKAVEVSLPVAKRATGTGEVPSIEAVTAAPVTSDEKPSRAGRWVAAVVVLAAAAVGGFFLYKNQLKNESQAEPASQQAAAAMTTEGGNAEVNPPTPEATAPAVVAQDEMQAADDESADGIEAAAEPQDGEEPQGNAEDAAKAEKAVVAKSARAETKDDSASDKGNKASKKDKPAGDKVAKAEAKSEPKQKPEEEVPTAKSGEDIDDVLSAVTGGVEDSKAAEVQEKKPTKSRLDRSDVAKAMGKVSPKAKACHSAEGFSGSVLVKFTVDPSGSVTKAKAKGAHASSATGKCVVGAVKGAKFPAFSGRPTSFTFPFLLSE